MNRSIGIIAAALIWGISSVNPSWAEEKAVLKVSGVVCSFCAQGIRKSFENTNAVNSIDVNLDKHEVTLEFLPGRSLSDKEITSVLESSGYNLLGVDRFESNRSKEGDRK